MNYTKLIERLIKVPVNVQDWKTIGEVKDAIEALQAECAEHKENAMRNARQAVAFRAERDQLQAKLGDAIQSSAHWQHQFTEAQAENDLLKGYRDRALELATAYNNAQENIEQINAHREHILAVNEKLTAQVDAMGKGEPVQYQYRDARDDGTWSAWVGCDKPLHPNTWRQVRELYAAPKALAPLKDEPWMVKAIDEAYGIGGTP